MSTLDTIDQETAATALATGDEFGMYQAATGRTKKVTVDQLPGGMTGRFRYFTAPVGWAAYSSTGTNTTLVAGTIYWADIVIPRPVTLTGIGALNGATVGTDKGLVGLYSSAGTLLANSATAGATTAGANAFQQYAFTATYAVLTPGRYWIGYQSNGTTDTLRTIAASTWADVLTTSATGSFGTLTALTPPTTFTADKGPYAYVY